MADFKLNNSLRYVGSLLALALAWTTTLSAQPEMPTLQGYVHARGEKPLAGVLICVTSTMGKSDQQTRTDDFWCLQIHWASTWLLPPRSQFRQRIFPSSKKGKMVQAEFDFAGQVRGPQNSVVSAVRDTIRVRLDPEARQKQRRAMQYTTGHPNSARLTGCRAKAHRPQRHPCVLPWRNALRLFSDVPAHPPPIL